MKYIDLRSDTVTQPTDTMRKVMFDAIVGDDVYEEDETVIRLEKLAAEIVGKEAALFVPSGTMGNQLAVMTHTKRGEEIIIDESYHIFQHEVGGAALISGVHMRTIKTVNGIMNPVDVKNAIREDNIHFPNTGLICMENANSLGTIVPIENMREIYEIARLRDIPVHLDGARVFNAAAALNLEVRELIRFCDSVMFCLSKGLCAPVGSILAGDIEFIAKARKNRKLLGGGMRQAGFLAAAGIVALEEMIERLPQDHQNAKLLASELAKINTIEIDITNVHINMVFFKINKADVNNGDFIQKMRERKIKINGPESGTWRFVTNNDVKKEDIEYIVKSVQECLS